MARERWLPVRCASRGGRGRQSANVFPGLTGSRRSKEWRGRRQDAEKGVRSGSAWTLRRCTDGGPGRRHDVHSRSVLLVFSQLLCPSPRRRRRGLAAGVSTLWLYAAGLRRPPRRRMCRRDLQHVAVTRKRRPTPELRTAPRRRRRRGSRYEDGTAGPGNAVSSAWGLRYHGIYCHVIGGGLCPRRSSVSLCFSATAWSRTPLPCI
jgi:hypothetical protein